MSGEKTAALVETLAQAALTAEGPDVVRSRLAAELGRRFECARAELLDAPADGAPAEAARAKRPVLAADRSVLAIPFVVRGRVAAVAALSGREGGFPPESVDAAADVARAAGAFVRLYASEERESRLSRQMLQMEKLASIGRLVAGFAHEVRNPLTVIRGFAESLEPDAKTPLEREGLARIRTNALRIEALVKNLLGFSRVSAATIAPIDLGALLDSSLELLSLEDRWDVVQVEKRFEAGAPEIAGNANTLMQVFMNLMVNAFQAMEGRPDSRLTLAVRRAGSGVVVEVSDNGPGIPADVLAKIFDPFFTTKGKQGTGLGLYLVSEIMDKHRGRVEAESTPGAGTKFRLSFPLAAPSRAG